MAVVHHFDEEQARACLETMIEVVSSEVVQGCVANALPHPIALNGVNLLRALFAAACRSKYPTYQTLIRGHSWRENIQSYIRALRDPAIFKDGQKTYLLYAVAGESGIGIAEIERLSD